MAATQSRFAEELKTYGDRLATWLEAGMEGHWVAVLGSRIAGPAADLDSVWDSAIREFQAGFMVKRIVRSEKPIIVSTFKASTKAGTR